MQIYKISTLPTNHFPLKTNQNTHSNSIQQKTGRYFCGFKKMT